jgi:hypothetical protein
MTRAEIVEALQEAETALSDMVAEFNLMRDIGALDGIREVIDHFTAQPSEARVSASAIETELLRQYSMHPEWDEAKDVIENIDCEAIAVLAPAPAQQWREMDESAQRGDWIVGFWTCSPEARPAIRFDRDHSYWIDASGDNSYSTPDLYFLLPPPKGDR